jgi:hypothetical protein
VLHPRGQVAAYLLCRRTPVSVLDIPRLLRVKRRGCVRRPRQWFVVEALVGEAAVEDADEPVGEGSEGLVVGGAPTVSKG